MQLAAIAIASSILLLSDRHLVLGSSTTGGRQKPIYDPYNAFCGPISCYDVLNLERNATVNEIKKSYRRLSRVVHPDKNNTATAKQEFMQLQKAHEVLSYNETKAKFDYYLDHPKDYYTATSGKYHYFHTLHNANAWLVIILTLLLGSLFFHFIQAQNHEVERSEKKKAIRENLKIRGGTWMTAELHKAAKSKYDAYVKGMGKGYKSVKMLEDPKFNEIVDEVMLDMEYITPKPKMDELFILRMPVLLLNAVKNLTSAPKPIETKEDKERAACNAVGRKMWLESSPAQRELLVSKEVWVRENLFRLMAQCSDGYASDSDNSSPRQRKNR